MNTSTSRKHMLLRRSAVIDYVAYLIAHKKNHLVIASYISVLTGWPVDEVWGMAVTLAGEDVTNIHSGFARFMSAKYVHARR